MKKECNCFKLEENIWFSITYFYEEIHRYFSKFSRFETDAVLSTYSVLSIKRTGGNNRTGWAEFFPLLQKCFYYMKNEIRVGQKFQISYISDPVLLIDSTEYIIRYFKNRFKENLQGTYKLQIAHSQFFFVSHQYKMHF